MVDAPCPLCSQELADPKTVYVCASCHGGLALTGAIAMRTTGEFKAPLPPSLTKTVDPLATTQPPTTGVACTWCGRKPQEVRKLLSHGSSHICNECVALAADIMQSELGEAWRG